MFSVPFSRTNLPPGSMRSSIWGSFPRLPFCVGGRWDAWCPAFSTLLGMRAMAPSALSVLLATHTAQRQRSAWDHTNPTTNVHSEGCVKNKSWAHSRGGVGPSCSRARSQQSPDVRGTSLRAEQGAERLGSGVYLRGGVYFPLFLKERRNPAPCSSTASWKDAFLLPAQQGAAKNLHLHFMGEEKQLGRRWFAQGHAGLLTASSQPHVQPAGPRRVFETPPEVLSQPGWCQVQSGV